MNQETGVVEIKQQQVAQPVNYELRLQELKERRNFLVTAMKEVLVEADLNEGKEGDYGKVPGCGNKQVLLKPGAEKICNVFYLRPAFEFKTTQLENGHIDVECTCTLTSPEGEFMGQGIGSCSTLESKYRYRSGYEDTGKPVPKKFWDDNRDVKHIGGKGFSARKNEDDQWTIHQVIGREENPDVADQYNTIKKMSKKRALIDATITATGASDIFTQDIEESVRKTYTEKKTVSKKAKKPQAGSPSQPQPKPMDDGIDLLARILEKNHETITAGVGRNILPVESLSVARDVLKGDMSEKRIQLINGEKLGNFINAMCDAFKKRDELEAHQEEQMLI